VKHVKNPGNTTLVYPTLDPPLTLAPGEVAEVADDVDLIGTVPAPARAKSTAGTAEVEASVQPPPDVNAPGGQPAPAKRARPSQSKAAKAARADATAAKAASTDTTATTEATA